MPPPPLLTIKYKTSGTVQVYRLVDGINLFAVGGPLGATLETPSDNGSRSHNRVIQFKNKLYACHRDKVYQYDPENPSNDWQVVHTIASPNGFDGENRHTGLEILQRNGNPIVVMGYVTNGNFQAFIRSSDGTTWVDPDVSFGGEPGASNRHLVWRNQLLWVTVSNKVSFYDPSLNIAFSRTMPNWTRKGMDLLVFKNRLFAVGNVSSASGADFVINEYTGGTWQLALTLSGTDGGATAENRADAFFTDETDMFLIFQDATDDTTKVYKIVDELTGGLTPTDITATVVPASLKAGGAHSPFDDGQWSVFMDNQTNPEIPKIWLWFLPDDVVGQNYLLWEWNGSSSLISGPTTGPPVGLALVHSKDGGGNRIWTDGEKDVEITNVGTVAGGQRISFKAYDPAGSGSVKARFLFSEDEEIPTTPCTLIGPVTGGSATLVSNSSGDIVDNVTADDGVTTYTIIWDVATDGVFDVSRANIMPVIEDI